MDFNYMFTEWTLASITIFQFPAAGVEKGVANITLHICFIFSMLHTQFVN
jgi:hypothetical protein